MLAGACLVALILALVTGETARALVALGITATLVLTADRLLIR
jgi:hypothetical protein